MGVSKTSDPTQIKIKMPNPGEKPTVSSKASNEDLKDVDAPCTIKTKIESQILEYGCIKDQLSYTYQDQPVTTSSTFQSPKAGFKGNGCSLHLQKQDRGPKFGIWLYQRPVTL